MKKKEKKPTRQTSRGAERLASLRKGLDNYKDSQWPGGDFHVRLIPLSDSQIQESHAGALRRFSDLGIPVNLYTSEELNIEVHIQALALSMHDPEDGDRLWNDADELRDAIEPQERQALVSEFLDLQNRANPGSIDSKLVAEIDELIKKKDVGNLSCFGSSTLAAFLIYGESQRSS